MADNMSYSSHQYLPPHPQYYNSPPVSNNAPIHIVQPSTRPDLAAQRKRPKYTRSKTGCLTCRVKKIKCDETKPQCMRCTHGSRECSWPEGVPARKKSVARRDEVDGRPSTAGSSGLSDASTPPARDLTPPRLNLVQVPSRAPSENFVPMHPISSEHDTGRRQLDRSYSHSHSNSIPLLPEPSYASRYEPSYLHSGNSQSTRLPQITSYRNMSHQPNHWSHSPEAMDPYYPSHGHHHHGVMHERPLVSHTSPSNDHSHNRYQ